MAKPSIAEALGAPEKEPAEDDEEDPGDMDAHGVAASETLAAAVKSGDGAAIWDAFKTLAKLCDDYEEDESGEE